MRERMIGAIFLVGVSLCHGAPGKSTAANSPDTARLVVPQDVDVPVSDNAGGTIHVRVRICERSPDTKHPILLFIHGDPGYPARLSSNFPSCDIEPIAWFVDRGFAFVFALRSGFGPTGGPFLEENGSCAESDYLRNGLEIARQTDAVLHYILKRKDVNPDQIVVLGHSAGGWGTLAYNGLNHPGVIGFINMAGGKGGRFNGNENHICRLDQLSAAAANFARNAKTPMLWIYAKNDSIFVPEVAHALFSSFTKAGGVAKLLEPNPTTLDGHMLLFESGGSAYWGPLFEQFLEHVGMRTYLITIRTN